MSDFKIGDKVILLKNTKVNENHTIGKTGIITDIRYHVSVNKTISYNSVSVKFDNCPCGGFGGFSNYCDGFPVGDVMEGDDWLKKIENNSQSNFQITKDCTCSSFDLTHFGHLPGCSFYR